MGQTGSIYSVAPGASLIITSCSVLQACFPRTNIILIYNATKDKAGFLILISDSLIISSIKTVTSFRLFFHVLFWFGTETEQMSISAPWVTWFISSFIKPGDLLESTPVVLKDFWTSWTGLAAVSNQGQALVSITLYQVIDLWKDNAGGGSEDGDKGLFWKSKHQPFPTNSNPRCCWEACQQNACSVHQHAPDIGSMYRNGLKNVKCNVVTSLDFLLAF